ncbi:MAG: hypothetical protein Q9187_005066 [Circinaria calcarea]
MSISSLQNGKLTPGNDTKIPDITTYTKPSLTLAESEDDIETRRRYRPFLLDRLDVETVSKDWVSELELDTAMEMSARDLERTGERLKVLVLFGSLRRRLGCDVRVYDPSGLPVKDDVQASHEKVQELRELSRWSDGHTAVFKNQIDWIPLATGSVRPTQGRTLAIAQVSGGSQSFNTVNSLRVLGRWMRMFVIPNQSSIPMAYTQFTDEGGDDGSRLKASSNRDRLVDCMEEFVKYTIVMRPHFRLFEDRFSERQEKRVKEKLAANSVVPDGGISKSAGVTESKGTTNGVNLRKI